MCAILQEQYLVYWFKFITFQVQRKRIHNYLVLTRTYRKKALGYTSEILCNSNTLAGMTVTSFLTHDTECSETRPQVTAGGRWANVRL